jgi:uncharacterized membrane protein
VTLWSTCPLLVFLALFAGVWIFFELRGIIQFSSLRPLYLLVVTPWIWWMHFAGLSGLRGARGVLALMTRLALIGVFIMLLAEPRAVRRSNVLSVVYAVDISDSVGEEALDGALEYVAKTVTQKPEKDEAGLIVFGRDAAVELPPRISFPFEGIINSRIIKDSTNIAKGLSLAAAVLPEENHGRIVFISDGTQTEGDLGSVLDELKSRGIAVDVFPIHYDYENEVWLEDLQLPRLVKAGETYEASIILSSLKPGRGKLSLQENGRTIFTKEVQFKSGKNRYVLPLYLRTPGYYEYIAAIETPPGKDGWDKNNIAINHLHLRGRGKILVVTDPEGETEDAESLVDALKATGRAVELRSATSFPRDTLSLMPYDCVVFPNVPADAFDAVQLAALKDSVFNQGTGFLMVGGKNSFGPGAYHRTAVEEILPVSMDISRRKVMPKGALVIVLHTCEFAMGNTWGKRIAKEAIRVLGEKDDVGILVYTIGREQWLFPLTPAGEYNKLVTLINRAQIGDMLSFTTTMQMGLNALKANDAAMKHMIIISDGDPSPPPNNLIQGYIGAKISVSTISINPHGNVATPIMPRIASATGGRHYFPKDPRKLPSIFIKEAKTLKRSMIQNITFTPEVDFPSLILKGIEALPGLHGYVLTTPKDRASVILKGPETEEVDPVLAVWRYGLAKTAAFTSDLSTNWGKDWVEWDKYRAFVNQLMTDISRVSQKSDLHMEATPEGSDGLVVITDYSEKESFLGIEARVAGPRGISKTVELKQVGPGRYSGKFPLWGKGMYQITAIGIGEGRNERCLSGFAVPYSPEYLRFRSNPFILEEIVRRTGGRMLTGDETGEQIFGRDRRPKDSSRPVFDWFLILLACLIPFDVAVRRIQIELRMILGWFGFGRKKVKSETLDALLQVKKGIKFTGDEKKEAEDLKTVPVARIPAGGREPPSGMEKAPGAKKEKMTDAQKLSTTERLLAMKKKWKKKDSK